MISGHGNHITDIKEDIVADFSTNVYANPLTNNILEYLKENIECIQNYPDCTCSVLRKKIATLYNLESNNILITNGSTEAFYLVAHTFQEAKSVIQIPSFAEYRDACKLYNHNIEFLSTQYPLHKYNFKNMNVWLGNPNNPDGKYYTQKELSKLISAHPETTFIIDEAYIELCKNGESIAPKVAEFPNLIVIKSFTKRFAVPGIRIGFILANQNIINRLLQYHMPWAVNSMALKTGEFIMDNYAHQKPNTEELLMESSFLQKQVSQLNGFEVIPTNCNYFLVQTKLGTAADLKEYLISNHGILIRDAANFKGLDQSYFRVAAQKRDMNIKLLNGLKQWSINRS